MARITIHHPLIAALLDKRDQYLARGYHGEAHGMATAARIALAWLQKEPITMASGFAPLSDPEKKSS
jgi:hypothetical protein